MSSSETLAAGGGATVDRRPGTAAGVGATPSRYCAAARTLIALVVAIACAGCGFHLRGDVTYAFSTLYVTGPPQSPIVLELTRTLDSGGNTHLVAAPADAQVVLEVTNVTDDKGVLSLSSGGRVREYVLTKRVAYLLHDAAGRDWVPPSEIAVRRSYTFNESEVLAREQQEQRLLREMQTDAVQQIVRRLQTARKPAA
jgi:LPS-assembly lipoprotein